MNAVEMRGISKNFGTVQALSNVDFTLRQGEIHAVLGENGAGKTTLMKILYGMHKPSSGEIFLNGKSVTLRDSQAAIRAGVGMVHQHFMLIPVLTVAENIALPLLLADEPTGNLDSENTRQVMALLRGFHQSMGQTILMITHDRELALQAQRILTLEDGRIVRDEVNR